jgi:hypothetical protein
MLRVNLFTVLTGDGTFMLLRYTLNITKNSMSLNLFSLSTNSIIHAMMNFLNFLKIHSFFSVYSYASIRQMQDGEKNHEYDKNKIN